MAGRRIHTADKVAERISEIMGIYRSVPHPASIDVHVFTAVCNVLDSPALSFDPVQFRGDVAEAIAIANGHCDSHEPLYPALFWKAMEMTTSREVILPQSRLAVPTERRH